MKNATLNRLLAYLSMTVLLVIIALVVFMPRDKRHPARDSLAVSSPTITPVATPGASSTWFYFNATDSMSGRSEWLAITRSTNTFEFSRPYQGPQQAKLTIRRHPRYGNDVILEIERGQFMSGVTGVQVVARFDNGQPVNFWGRGPADYSSTSLFLDYSRFVARLRKAKIVRLSTPIYQEGAPVFEFDVAGFDLKGK